MIPPEPDKRIPLPEVILIPGSCTSICIVPLIADLECLSKEAPDAKRHVGNFKPVEAVKSVPLDPSNDAGKKVRIGFELDPK